MRCRDCKHMVIGLNDRIFKDKVYRCGVSVPSIDKILPYSIAASYWTKLDKMMVSPVEEHSCSFFEKK